RFGHAADREVVRFGPAAREHDFGRIAPNQCRHSRSGLVESGLRLLAEVMNTRRVAEKIPCSGSDGVGNPRGEGGRRVVVKIDTHREPYIVSSPLTAGRKRTRQHNGRLLY